MKEFQCGICLSLLRTPMQCKNGHIFCEECIKCSLRSRSVCPTCRCSLEEKDLSRVLVVDRMLATLDIWCSYRYRQTPSGWEIDGEGCPTVCKYENVELHEKQCEFAWASCTFSKECKIRKRDLAEHKSSCEYRPVECEFCHLDFQSNALSDHKSKCKAAPTSCDSCGEKLRRADLTYHQQKQCPEQPLVCPYNCNQRILRKDLKDHLNKNIIEHLEELRLSFSRTLKDMEDKHQKEILSLEKKIQSAKDSRRASEIKVNWQVRDWNFLAKKSGYSQSKKFELDGLTWYLGIYPNGDTPDSKGWISLYLFYDGITGDNTIKTRWKMSLVNTNPANTITREHTVTFPLSGGQGWGERRLIQTSVVSNDRSGFVVNDSLRVSLEFRVLLSTYEL
eukprot:TRINITY_DN2956_c0_g1_i1.p1 TRINITY_DN2956_c0_g1~~TRINITY_DN2956_c0_g1_i1.p1  ORF type:complete len:411 (+),score=39.48 TRINITY_DN2956_c0_g1_i1:60-1235(+)